MSPDTNSQFHTPLHSAQLPSLKLPQSEEDWLQSDREIATTVVPAVLAAPTVDMKHEALCQGIYQHFSSLYGSAFPRKPRRKRRHARQLKKLTAEKNEARKEFRRAKASATNDLVIQQLAQKFYRLVRLHSAEKKLLLKSKCRLEALKARRECSRAFWRYAAKVLDGESESVVPQFDGRRAEEFFTEVYSAGQQHFSSPNWLPSPSPPSVDFNTQEIRFEEITNV